MSPVTGLGVVCLPRDDMRCPQTLLPTLSHPRVYLGRVAVASFVGSKCTGVTFKRDAQVSCAIPFREQAAGRPSRKTRESERAVPLF